MTSPVTNRPPEHPEDWDAGKYMSYGVEKATEGLGFAARGLGTLFRIGILLPIQGLGHIASAVEMVFYGENSSSPPALKDRGVSEGDFDNATEAANKIKELESKLAALKGAQAKNRITNTSGGGANLPENTDGDREPVGRIGGRVGFKAADDDKSKVEEGGSSGHSSQSFQEVSDTEVEDFVSPLYNKEEAPLLKDLDGMLKERNPNLNLSTLLQPPAPPKPVIAPVGRGGPPPPPPPPNLSGKLTASDAIYMTKFGISKDELALRREALKDVYHEVSQKIVDLKKTNREVKVKNSKTIDRAHRFEDERIKNMNALQDYKTELSGALQNSQMLQSYITDYEMLMKRDPDAKSDVVLTFSMYPGQGEPKIVDLPIKEVVERDLIKGYTDEVSRIEGNIKNLIKAMNISKRQVSDELYQSEMTYSSKQTGPDGVEIVQDKKIVVKEFLVGEKNLKAAEESKEALREQMKLYGVEPAREKVSVEEVVQGEMSAVERAKLEAEKKAKLDKEMNEKIGGLKPSNVAAFSFKVKS